MRRSTRASRNEEGNLPTENEDDPPGFEKKYIDKSIGKLGIGPNNMENRRLRKARANKRQRVNRNRRKQKLIEDILLKNHELELKFKTVCSVPQAKPSGLNASFSNAISSGNSKTLDLRSSSFHSHPKFSILTASAGVNQKHERSRKDAESAIHKVILTSPLQISSTLVDVKYSQWAGAYGKVFIGECFFIAGGPLVAVKRAKSGDLLKEAKVLHYLQGGHAAIPYLYGMMGTNAIVIELVSIDNCTLNYHLKKHSFTFEIWVNVLAEVGDGLAFIHSKGIIHNDLHENNVLITQRSGAPGIKIIDFGSATLQSNPRRYFLTDCQRKMYREKHNHIAWELREGNGQPQTTLSDVYSFGRLIRSVGCRCKIAPLASISSSCRNHIVGRRPSADTVATMLRSLLPTGEL